MTATTPGRPVTARPDLKLVLTGGPRITPEGIRCNMSEADRIKADRDERKAAKARQ